MKEEEEEEEIRQQKQKIENLTYIKYDKTEKEKIFTSN